MIYNSTDLNASEEITDFEPEPTWAETFSASVDSFKAASLSISELMYYTDERDKNMAEWKSKDPENKMIYDRIGTLNKEIYNKLDALYEENDIEAIKGWGASVLGGNTIGEDFLEFKRLVGEHGFMDLAQVQQQAKDNSYNDYMEAEKVIGKSDSWTAKALGTMFGALHDPITLATLPMGGWVSGYGVAGNALRAAGQEALIEAGAQTIIAPISYAYKNEIGIRTSIATEATNAIAGIAGAGLLRGTASATFDLTEKGIKALKLKDPELAADYEGIIKSQTTDNAKEHIDNLHKAEFGEMPSRIENPNEKGMELNEAPLIPENNPDYIKAAQEAKVEDVIKLYHGTDKDFTYFDTAKAGTTQGLDRDVIFFTTDKDRAATFDARYPQKPKYRYTEADKKAVVLAEKSVKEIEIEVKDALTLKDVEKLYNEGKIKTKPNTKDLFSPESGHDLNREAIREAIEISGKKVFKHTAEGETHYAFYDAELVNKGLKKAEAPEMKIYSGTDEAGEPIYKSHKELTYELDMEETYIKKAMECGL